MIVRGHPPLFEAIADALPEARKRGVIFAWGRTIYNPSGIGLTDPLVAHEHIHALQQGDDEATITQWWCEYIADPEFRLTQEIPAHVAEYLATHRGGNRNERRAALKQIGRKLAAPLYGNLLTVKQAVDILKKAEGLFHDGSS